MDLEMDLKSALDAATPTPHQELDALIVMQPLI